MRRVIAVLTVLAALVVAATALAVLPPSGSRFKGKVNQPKLGGKYDDPVSFAISGRKVKAFKFGSFGCSGGFGGPAPPQNPWTQSANTVTFGPMKIKSNGKFSGSAHHGNADFKLSGKFSKSGKKAAGKITLTFAENGGDCGSVTFTAKKKGR